MAKELAKEYDLKVLDNYVQRLQKKTDLALGPWSSYSEHFMVAGVRYAEEEALKFADRITVGTIIDSLTYAAVHSDVLMQRTQADVRAMYASAQGAMQGLSLMYTETWDYDLSFFLPYDDEKRKEKEGTWEGLLDSAYTHVLELYGVPYCYKIEGDHSNRKKIVKAAIDLARQQTSAGPTEASPVEEPAV